MATSAAPESVFNATEFRQVLGSYPTGVTVITAATPDGPNGMAVNSFTSVSLDPPLVLFCAGKTSSTWPLLRDADGGLTINLLSAEQEPLCRAFATKGIDRFAGVAHHPGATGAPVLDDALAHLDCLVEAEHDAGDHTVVIARVVALGSQPGTPLVFHASRYTRLAD